MKRASRAQRLIYVEDDVVSICIAQQLVAGRPHVALATAANVDRALALSHGVRPDVMLVNIDIAEMGAATLIKILRANPATRACPVLAVGADASARAAVKALEAGFFLYLAKPLQAALLGDALGYALESAAGERAEL